MSAIANLRSAPAAFPPLNLQPHGHKKGPHIRSPEDSGSSSDSAAQVPAGLRQNLFGSLLNSLEQAIGLPLTAPTAAAAGSTTSAAAANVQSSVTMLQNYLNNLAHNPQTDGSPAARFAGSSVSVSA